MVMMKRKNLLAALGISAWITESGRTAISYDDKFGIVFDSQEGPDYLYTNAFRPASECPAFIRRSPYVGVTQ